MAQPLSERVLLQAAILRDHLERSGAVANNGEMTEWLRRKGFRRDQAQALAAGRDDEPLNRKERRLLSKLASTPGVPAIVEQIEERLDAIHTILGTYGGEFDAFELGVIARDALRAWVPVALDTKTEPEQRVYFGQISTMALVSLRKKKTTLEQRRRGMLAANVLIEIDDDATRDSLQSVYTSSIELIDSWLEKTPEANTGATKVLRVLRHLILSDSLELQSEVGGNDVAMSADYVTAGVVEEALFASDLLGHSRVSILHNAFRLAMFAGDYARTIKVGEVYFGNPKYGGAGYAKDIREVRTPQQGGVIDDQSEWPGLAVLLVRGDAKKLREAHHILTQTSGAQYGGFNAGVERARALINKDAPYQAVMTAMINGGKD